MKNKTENGIGITMVPMSKIKVNPDNRDLKVADVTELAENIKSVGLINPIMLRDTGTKEFTIIAGERRYLACKKLGRVEIQGVIVKCTDEQAMEIMLSENLQRVDLTTKDIALMVLKLKNTNVKLTAKEIALALGISIYATNQYLVLNNLIKEFMLRLDDDEHKMEITLRIARLSKDVQKQLFNAEGLNVSQWDLKQYTYLLNPAPFDIKDATLDPKMGACGPCPFNSTNAGLLFANEANAPICTKGECYSNKTKVAFGRQLEVVKADPTTIVVSNQTIDNPMIKDLTEQGHRIMNMNNYQAIYPPRNIIADDGIDVASLMEDDDDLTEAQANKMLKNYEKEYQEELKEYNKLIKSELAIRAYDADNEKWIHVLKKENTKPGKSADIKTAIKEDTVTVDMLQGEINRIQENKKRKVEIEDNNLYEKLYEEMTKDVGYLARKNELCKEELILTIITIFETMNYTIKDKAKKIVGLKDGIGLENYKMLVEKTVKQLHQILIHCLRITSFAHAKAQNEVRHTKDGRAAAFYDVMEEWNPVAKKKLSEEYLKVLDKYTENVDKKVKDLKGKIAELKKNK